MTTGIAWKNLKEGLYSKDTFHNTLTNCKISDKNYEHVCKDWKDFKMNSIKNYHVLNLKLDVLLLVCGSKTCTKEFMNSFELVSVHYLYTS